MEKTGNSFGWPQQLKNFSQISRLSLNLRQPGFADEHVCCWPSAAAAPVSRGVRSLGSTCRRGDVADRRGPRDASPASAIEASSAVTAKKLGSSVCPPTSSFVYWSFLLESPIR